MFLAAGLLASGIVAGGAFVDTHPPTFWHGAEFPGATGRLEVAAHELRLHYDFTKGGHYVAANFPTPERQTVKKIVFEADVPGSTEVTVRVTSTSSAVNSTPSTVAAPANAFIAAIAAATAFIFGPHFLPRVLKFAL